MTKANTKLREFAQHYLNSFLPDSDEWALARDISQVLDENQRLREALNKIAMLGCSEIAYTADFTERVNSIAREVLESKGDNR